MVLAVHMPAVAVFSSFPVLPNTMTQRNSCRPSHRKPHHLGAEGCPSPVCHPAIACMCRGFTHTAGGCSVVTSRSSLPAGRSFSRRPPETACPAPVVSESAAQRESLLGKSCRFRVSNVARHLSYRRPHAACGRRRGIQLQLGSGAPAKASHMAGRLVRSISERKLTDQGAGVRPHDWIYV
jgi:hypothetical protein